MKRLQTAILLTILPLLTGCLKQNRSLCEVEDNLTLLFRYEPAVGTDRFAEYIGSVNVYLYDAEHKLMEARRIEKTDLELFQGTTFTVVPGDYYVVCWGNVSANSQFSGNGNGAPLSAGRVSAVSHKTGCKLYYAPFKNVGHPDGDVTDLSAYKITVPAQKAVKRTMLFVRAYRTINVYAQGYEDSYGGGDQPLDITVTRLACEYDFMLRESRSRRNYTQTTTRVNTAEGIMAMSSINSPYREIDSDIEVQLAKKSDGSHICAPVNLKQYVDRHYTRTRETATGAGVDDDHFPHDIDIVVRFRLDGSVTIEMPDWGESEVDPVIGGPA